MQRGAYLAQGRLPPWTTPNLRKFRRQREEALTGRETVVHAPSYRSLSQSDAEDLGEVVRSPRRSQYPAAPTTWFERRITLLRPVHRRFGPELRVVTKNHKAGSS
jgi:hypothetical protein